MATTGRRWPKPFRKASRQDTASGDPTDRAKRDVTTPCGAGTDRPLAGEGRDLLVIRDADGTGGDTADSGGGRGNHGRLDRSGNDRSGGRVTRIGGDRNSGLVIVHDGSGAIPRAMSLAEVEDLIPSFSAGTRIGMPQGPCPVENLCPVALGLTPDDGPQPGRSDDAERARDQGASGIPIRHPRGPIGIPSYPAFRLPVRGAMR